MERITRFMYSEGVKHSNMTADKKIFGNQTSVLMIEDDVFLTELLTTKFDQEDYISYRAPNAKIGIEQAKLYKPSVIILDLMLPGMSGEDALKIIKSDPELKHTPVIVFSNIDQDSDVARMKELGVTEFFVKASTEIDVLVKSVSKHAA